MCQSAQNTSFPFEPLLASTAVHPEADEFDCGTTLESTIAAFGQPDIAHPALADGRKQRVGARGLSGSSGLSRQRDSFMFEKTFLRKRIVFLEKHLQLVSEFWLLLPQRSEPGGALVLVHGKSLVKIRAYG